MTELPIKATLKAGAGYDAPWLTVDAADPADLQAKMEGLIRGEVMESVIDAANFLKAANVVREVPTQAPVVNNGPTAQQAAAPGWAQPQAAAPAAPPAQSAARFHPEGILCPSCQTPVVFKEITSKKSGKLFQMWTCPNQRSRDDGHYSQFAN